MLAARRPATADGESVPLSQRRIMPDLIDGSRHRQPHGASTEVVGPCLRMRMSFGQQRHMARQTDTAPRSTTHGGNQRA